MNESDQTINKNNKSTKAYNKWIKNRENPEIGH